MKLFRLRRPQAGEAGFETGYPKKSVTTTDDEKYLPLHSWALNFPFSPSFLDSDPCQIFSCLKKFSLEKILFLLAWLEVILHYQLSSPVQQKYHIFTTKMNLNVDMSIFWGFSLISMLETSISFSNFNRIIESGQSILIQNFSDGVWV